MTLSDEYKKAMVLYMSGVITKHRDGGLVVDDLGTDQEIYHPAKIKIKYDPIAKDDLSRISDLCYGNHFTKTVRVINNKFRVKWYVDDEVDITIDANRNEYLSLAIIKTVLSNHIKNKDINYCELMEWAVNAVFPYGK